MSDRSARDLRAAVKTSGGSSVQFQRTGAEVPREAPAAGGMDNLSRSFQGFFGAVTQSVAQMRESELRTEVQQVQQENQQLALEGKAAADQGLELTDATPEQQTRNAFVFNFKNAMGERLFRNNDLEVLDKTINEWDPVKGDARAYVENYIKEKTQGMDPLVAAAYTIEAKKSTETLIQRQSVVYRQQMANLGADSYMENFTARLQSGEAITLDDLDNATTQLERTLMPVGKATEARARVNEALFKYAERNPDAEWARKLIEAKDASGVSLAERFPERVQKINDEQVRREGSVMTVDEDRDLRRIEFAIQNAKLNPDGNLQGLVQQLFAHRMEFGKGPDKFASDRWVKMQGEVAGLFKQQAGYLQFNATIEGRINGVPGAARLGADQEANWTRWVSEANKRGVPFEMQATAFAAHGYIPEAVTSNLRADLSSEKDGDRVRGFTTARKLEAAFDNNPNAFASSLGPQGLLVYRVMDNMIRSGADPQSVSDAGRRAQASGMKIDDVALGDNKPTTVKSWVDNVDSAMRSSTTTFWQRNNPFGDTPAVEVSGALRSRIEAKLRETKMVADLGYARASQSEIEKTVAQLVMADAEATYIDGKVLLTPRSADRVRMDGNAVAPSLTYTPAEIGKAVNQFKQVQGVFPGLGELARLTPSQNGQGYEVAVPNKDGIIQTLRVPLGTEFAGAKVPEIIPDYGWQPPGLEKTGFMFVPYKGYGGGAIMVYRGETAQEGAYRMSVDEANSLRGRLNAAQTEAERVEALRQQFVTTRPDGTFDEPAFQARLAEENARRRAERDARPQSRFELGYWMNKLGNEMATSLATGGFTNQTAFMRMKPIASLESEEDVMKYLENLMNNAGVSARFMPNEGNPQKAYSNQRYDFISKVEGVRYEAYDDATSRKVSSNADVTGNRTIGIGFNMERPDAKRIFRDILSIPEKDFDVYYSGKKSLSQAHVMALFNHTADEAERIVDNRLGDVADKLSKQQRLVLVSLAFNNPELVGPNLIAAIKAGKLDEAAREIRLRSNKSKNPGIQSRREAEADMFATG